MERGIAKEVSKSKTKRPSTFHERRDGFALIITISLMAFLVLLLVALTTLTRVETQLANNSQQTQVARENARLALGLAIGQLQRYAGKDEAVTARADIEGTGAANDRNPYWTGVWDDLGFGPEVLTWLVSGNEDPNNRLYFEPTDFDYDRTRPDPYTTPSGAPAALGAPATSGAGVRLVGRGTGFPDPTLSPANSIAEGVVAPLVPILTPPNTYPGLNGTPVIGHYAYWVADQGVKASMAKVERHLDSNSPPLAGGGPWVYAEEELQRLRQLLPQRFGHEAFFSNLSIIENDPLYRARMGQIKSFHQMREVLLQGTAGSPPVQYEDFSTPRRDALRTHFHDLTHFNFGVLAGPGGLKRDLSSSRPRGIDDYMRLGYPFADAVLPPYDIHKPRAVTGAGTSNLTIAPVITEALFKYSVWADGSSAADRPVSIRLEAEVELWNPYNADLNGGSLFVRLVGPSLNVFHDNVAVGSGPLDFAESGVAEFEIPLPNMAPGVIRVFIPVAVEEPAVDSDGTLLILSAIEPGDADEVRLEGTNLGNLRLELWIGKPEAAGSQRLSRYEDLDFDPLVTGDYPADDQSPKLGFYIRMRDAGDDEDWLTYYDPRGTVLVDLDDAGEDVAGDPFEIEADVEEGRLISLNSFPGELLRPINDIVLFELPLQEVVNMGSLQHVYFHRRGAYALGNAWGGSVNNLFDTHFISTIPQDPTWRPNGLSFERTQFPVPHTGMVPYRGNGNDPLAAPLAVGLQSEDSARHLLLQGMFNINSTSIDAWRSVLSAFTIENNPFKSEDTDWEYGAGSRLALRNAVFRFSQTAHTSGILVRDTNSLSNLATAYSQGVRPDIRMSDIDALAAEIVFLLRQNGEPFMSLADFVNSGLLQDAIDTVNINGSIPRYSPAFITQADIITLLAPFMLARSDTFLIRAYGDAFNPVTGVVDGRAWCEAIVQRVPTPFAESDHRNNFRVPQDTNGFGRKFEVIYFRWLDSSEL